MLAKIPSITGNCASSPSRKKPITVSPGAIRIDLARFAFPEPPCDDNNTCAQGNLLSGYSVISAG